LRGETGGAEEVHRVCRLGIDGRQLPTPLSSSTRSLEASGRELTPLATAGSIEP
jgi:hypothetical protein